MTVAQAFKHKNKLISKIKVLEDRIISNNSFRVSDTPDYDVKDLFSQLAMLKAELVDLKTRIVKTNIPVYEKIYELAELKSKISLLKRMNTDEGIKYPRFSHSETEVEYKAVISTVERDSNIETAEEKIEKLQEELDKFNYTTNLV